MRTCSRCRLDETKTTFTPKGNYCRPCSAIAHREWAAKNKEKLRAYSAKWLDEHREAVNAKYRDRKREKTRAYRAANREKVNALQRERRLREDPEKRRQRMRDWYKKNPDKRKANSKRDYDKHGRSRRAKRRDEVNAYGREWHKKHAEKRREKSRKWNREHPEEHQARVKAWRDANPGRAAASFKEWRRKNPERMSILKQRRYARQKGAEGAHSAEEWATLLAKYDHRCAYCPTPLDNMNRTRDHKVPLTRGGSNRVDNLVPACRSCNSKKGTMTHEEFVTRRGRPPALNHSPRR